MQAVFFEGNRTLRVGESVAVEPGAGQVQIRVAYCGICGTDLHLFHGAMALILVVARGRLKKTLFNVSFILSEMKSARPAYLKNEELDVKNKRSLGLPHGAVIAVSTIFYLALSARLTR